jgi:malonyl-CoA/methylmalonyl-CoA synthetase
MIWCGKFDPIVQGAKLPDATVSGGAHALHAAAGAGLTKTRQVRRMRLFLAGSAPLLIEITEWWKTGQSI